MFFSDNRVLGSPTMYHLMLVEEHLLWYILPLNTPHSVTGKTSWFSRYVVIDRKSRFSPENLQDIGRESLKNYEISVLY